MSDSFEEIQWSWAVIDAYKPIPEEEATNWRECPKCLKKPRLWEFDNGRYAKCLCGGKYDGAHVSAVSIGDHWRKYKTLAGFDDNELRNNWNNWVENQNPVNAQD